MFDDTEPSSVAKRATLKKRQQRQQQRLGKKPPSKWQAENNRNNRIKRVFVVLLAFRVCDTAGGYCKKQNMNWVGCLIFIKICEY